MAFSMRVAVLVSPSHSSIRAAERMVPMGLAFPWPAMSGAVP